MTNRRDFLVGAGALGAASLLRGTPAAGLRGAWSAPSTGGPPRTLVVLQLAGGNDGLSTVVPWGDDAYRGLRPKLGLPKHEVLPLDEHVGLGSGLERLRAEYDAGRLAVIQGVGYPDPNRSHFRSFDIWHAADLAGRGRRDGWLGRLQADLFGDDVDPNRAVHVGATIPYSLHSAAHPAVSFAVPAGYRWAGGGDQVAMSPEPTDAMEESAAAGRLRWLRGVAADARHSSAAVRGAVARHEPRAEYPSNNRLGDALRAVAALMQSDMGTRIFSVELDGFDTHNDQVNRHATLRRTLDEALAAFLDDVAGTEAAEHTTVAIFSEFGRRAAENASAGTDHGTAGPMFVLGAPVRGGLYGEHPSLEELDDNGDLIHTTDFRSVYATLIQDWMGGSAESVLGAKFERLPLFG